MTSGYGTILRRHIALVVVMGLVGLGLGGLLYAQRDQSYEASADVRLTQVTSPFRSSDGTKADLSRALQTQIDLATSDLVRAKVQGSLAAKAPVVALHGERDELRFTARSDDRRVAADRANAWAAAYVAVLRAQADAADVQYQAGLETAYDRISQEIVALDAERRTASAESRPLLDLRREVLVTEIKALASRLGNAPASNSLGGEVVRRAQAPSSPANDDLLAYLLVGLGVGLVLGYIVAAIVEARRDLIRGAEDVELVAAGEPVLGPVATGADLATLERLSGDVSFLSLRAEALAVSSGAHPAVLGVLSSSGEVEAASVALGLALSMRRQGQRVLLLDANVGPAGVSDLLALNESTGLVDVLFGGVPVDTGITLVATSDGMELAVLPVGRLQAGDLAGPAFNALVQDLIRDQQLDALVMSAGGVSSSPDATAVAVVASSVLLVATVRQTRRRQLAAALRRLDVLAPKARAVVLATASRRGSAGRRQKPRDAGAPAQRSGAAAGSATEEGLTGLSRGSQ